MDLFIMEREDEWLIYKIFLSDSDNCGYSYIIDEYLNNMMIRICIII